MRSTARTVCASALGLVLVATIAARSIERDRLVAAGGHGGIEALLWPLPGSPTLLDQHGERLTAAALRDRVVVVSFVSAGCTIVCALRTLDLHRLAEAMPATLRDRVVVLGIDTDPARDTAAGLRAFSEGLFGGATRLRLIVSDEAAVAALAAKLHYPPSALPEPPPTVLVFDRRGQVAMTYAGDPFDGPRVLRDVALLETLENGIGEPARDAGAPR